MGKSKTELRPLDELLSEEIRIWDHNECRGFMPILVPSVDSCKTRWMSNSRNSSQPGKSLKLCHLHASGNARTKQREPSRQHSGNTSGEPLDLMFCS